MSFVKGLKHVAATVTALATAAGLLTVGAGVASAGPRDWLRPDATGTCEWDAAGHWVQRCDVWSPATGKNISVQIQPAARGGNAGLYLLDGLRATDISSAWLVDTNAAAKFVNNNITLIMPVGGESSFYTDWETPATYDLKDPVTYKWETFLTKELPVYLEQNFGVARNNNSVAGLSMGGTAAMNLAAHHRDQFRQVLSFSGYLTTTLPGMQTMVRAALLDAGGFNVNAMYGSIFSPRRFQNDPFLNMGNLRGADIYVSAASGTAGPGEAGRGAGLLAGGAVLEVFSNASTKLWALKAKASGLQITEDYLPVGQHNWALFSTQLDRAHDRILDVMNAW
ncbi:alpha/beta hydrolase [Corynebacterium caspium]|uniref:alpha/beta hydrolase n=1 Tax=Corynebacterium caspium TaxID=234828 RepID=UPI00036E4DF4|nr:alpha/beta hydrolase family protein [Corynebacterium caspium]WKD59985.1 Diacylglycerol acyltransferase/mycolyltransferase Ag85B precursor [Corynebacterium caspium DSM 44850]